MVAEAGRTELTRAASTRRCSPATGNASAQPGCSASSIGFASSIGLARRTGADARTLAPLGAGRWGDRETPVHDQHAIRRTPGTRAGIRIVVFLTTTLSGHRGHRGRGGREQAGVGSRGNASHVRARDRDGRADDRTPPRRRRGRADRRQDGPRQPPPSARGAPNWNAGCPRPRRACGGAATGGCSPTSPWPLGGCRSGTCCTTGGSRSTASPPACAWARRWPARLRRGPGQPAVTAAVSPGSGRNRWSATSPRSR